MVEGRLQCKLQRGREDGSGLGQSGRSECDSEQESPLPQPCSVPHALGLLWSRQAQEARALLGARQPASCRGRVSVDAGGDGAGGPAPVSVPHHVLQVVKFRRWRLFLIRMF